MKVLHINSSDSSGGAARACLDIHNALNQTGVVSRVLVQSKKSGSEEVYSININIVEKIKTLIRIMIDFVFMKLFTVEKRGRFTFSFTGKDLSKLKIVKDADIINLHWINEGFLSIDSLRKIASLGKPVVWTLHDMWAFTGGCHYSLGCTKFETECRNCPSLKISWDKDFSNRIFNEKVKLFNEFNLKIVTCSNWLSDEVKKSPLLRDKNLIVIPNTLKTEVYRPLDRSQVLKELHLERDKTYILFGTMSLKDQRKGFDLFIECVKLLNKTNPHLMENVILLVAGSGKKMKGVSLPLKTIFIGRLTNEPAIARFYNAGSLFVAPSKEDNLPNTVMESLSCGTPVVGFNIGGLPDMIEHKINGYLAKPYDIKDLAEGIIWTLNHPYPERLRIASRSKILNNFSYQKIAESYKDLYNSLIY